MNEQECTAEMESYDGESFPSAEVEAAYSHESQRVSQPLSETTAEHVNMDSPGNSEIAVITDNINDAFLPVEAVPDCSSAVCLTIPGSSDTHANDNENASIHPSSGTRKRNNENANISSLQEKDEFTFSKMDLCLMLFSIVTYLFDIASDIWVAALHYRDGDFWWFGLTLTFVFLPCVMVTIAYLIRKGCMKPKKIMARAIPGGHVYFYVSNLYRGVKVINENDHRKKKSMQEKLITSLKKSAGLRLTEAFLEAAPQLVLQLYIMFSSPGNENHLLVAVQWAGVASSLVSLASALASAYKSRKMKHRKRVSHPGMFSIFLWRSFTVGARVFAFALFANFSGYGVFILTGIHYIIMLCWRIREERKLWRMRPEYDNLICKFDFTTFGSCVLSAFVLIFCYWDYALNESFTFEDTRRKYALYYTLVYMENIGMLFSWYFTTESVLWLQYLACTLIIGGFFIGIFFQAIFYVEFHPNNSEPNRTAHIKFWPPNLI